MSIGAITSYIDVAQLVLYGFWIFFAALVIYLLRENKREGYPLESDRSQRAPRVSIIGWPEPPAPKTFRLSHGGEVSQPSGIGDRRPVKGTPVAGFPGAPLVPVGDPMLAAVGPGSYAERADVPDLTFENQPKVVPLRVATDHWLEARDPDPRGKPVTGADGVVGGTVRDVWIDRSEVLVRYLELELTAAAGSRRVLLPINFAVIRRDGVRVQSILGRHFAGVPGLRNPDQVTLLEEDRICAYYGAGTLYAEPRRQEPWL